jgi:hypothetical protein
MKPELFLSSFLVILIQIFSATNCPAYPIVAPECKADPVECAKDGRLTAVEVYGIIGYEDQSFFENIDDAIPADKPFPKIFLDSQGGSGAVGEAIGRILRKRHATVEGGSPFIPETIVECTSACVFVAAGATTRWLNHVGIHQGHYTHYKGPKYWYNEPVETERTERDIKYFVEVGIDPEIGNIIRSTPSDQLSDFYYTDKEPAMEQTIVKLGFHMEGAPADTIVKMPVTEQDYFNARNIRIINAIDYGSNQAIYDHSQSLLRSINGQEPDYAEAIKWFEIGASRDDPHSLHMLGYYALYGKGMARDPKKSAEYYLRAAKLGYSGSQNNIGWAYYKGHGIPRSIPDAVFWITRSAEQGEPFAYGSLCEMHAAGDAFLKDDIEAFKWCRLAVDQEPEGRARDHDIELLQAYIHRMSVEDIKKGQVLADKWAPLKQTTRTMGDVGDG